MICKQPYMIGVQPCPCGRCLPCLINRRRVWSHRMVLESYKHGDSCWATLTYDEEHLPKDGSLDVRHYQLWLKKLRKRMEPEKLRFFLCGEYGDESNRPHYHVALFGLNSYVAGGADGTGGIVKDTWEHGFTFVGELTWESAQYIAGYVTKKMTSKEDPRLEGRHPEFARMSLRPGIGAHAMADVGKVMLGPSGLRGLVNGDVPHTLMHGMRKLPLGRYLRRRLRANVGKSEDVPDEAKKAFGLEMRVMFEDALKDPENTSKGLAKILVDKDLQKLRNVDARFRIFDSKKTL